MNTIRILSRLLARGNSTGEGATQRSIGLIAALVAGVALMTGIVGFAGAAVVYETGLMSRIKDRLLAADAGTPSLSDAISIEWHTVQTVLETLQVAEVPVGHVEDAGNGGGIAEFGGKLVFVTGHGSLGVIDPEAGKIRYLPDRIPMNLEGLKSHSAWDDDAFFRAWFRVHHMRIQPNKESGHHLYVSYNHFENGTICTRLSRVGISEIDGDVILEGQWDTFYESEPCVNLEKRGNVFYGTQSGGRLLFENDGTVLLTVGDYGFGAWTPDQFVDGALGDWSTLLRIDPETGEKQVVATGFRNPQGLVADDQGRIWSTEHGPKGGDELNLVVEGVNYGWPVESYGVEYGLGAEPRADLPLNPDQGRHRIHQAPILAFMPSVGLSGLAFLPNDTEVFDRWAGDLLLGSLNGNSIFRARVRDNRVVYSERIPLGHRLRDIIRLEDGQLAVWTDSRLIILIRDPDVQGEGEELLISGYQPIHEIEAGLAAARDTSWRREVFQLHCGQCHTVNGEPGIGPSLHSIEGRKIGADEYYPYSTALQGVDGKWSRSWLRAFVRNPEAAGFSNSAMQGLAIEDYLTDAAIDYASSKSVEENKTTD
ncbi:MAG: hypothetical protein B7X55_02045 [Rhodobacterales bacterium 34-62-10]|nr:MAG: hypothetical protein B7X55_02045 [Rhodobacterales bacterium 34-62-10]